MRRLGYSAALCALVCLPLQRSAAEPERVVVLAAERLDGRLRAESALESVAAQLLAARGLQVVDAHVALATQRSALAEQIAKGAVPRELSGQNAELLLSLAMSCDQSSASVAGTKMKAYGCALQSRLLRLGSGHVLFAESHDFTGHGLSASAAVQAVLRKRVPDALALAVDRWLADERDPDASWTVELVVTRAGDHATARALASKLAGLAGVKAARLTLFDRGIARYALEGRGQASVQGLGAALDGDPALALTLTFEAPRLLHAQYDAAEAQAVTVMVMAVAPAAQAQLAGSVLGSAPRNLPYLEMAQSAPLIAAPREEVRTLSQLRREATARSVPLLLTSRLEHGAPDWRCALDLRASSSGRVLLSARAQDADAGGALDRALRGFDERYRGALAERDFRVALGLTDAAAVGAEAAHGLVVTRFHVAADPAVGRTELALENRGRLATQAGRVAFVAAGRTLVEQPLPDLAVGGTEIVQLSAELLRAAVERAADLQAVVTYREGEQYGRVTAFAPLANVAAEPRRDANLPVAYFEAIERAIGYRRAGEFDKARDAFARAHGLYPNARTLRGLGIVAYDLGRYGESITLLRQALDSAVRPLDGPLRDETAQLIDRLQRLQDR